MPPPGQRRCRPRYYPSPGHEDTFAHDGDVDGRYFIVMEGHGDGIFTEAEVADRLTKGYSGWVKRSAKKWDAAVRIWEDNCDLSHCRGCPAHRHPAGFGSETPVGRSVATFSSIPSSSSISTPTRPSSHSAPSPTSTPVASPRRAPVTPENTAVGSDWLTPSLATWSSPSPSPVRVPVHLPPRAPLAPPAYTPSAPPSPPPSRVRPRVTLDTRIFLSSRREEYEAAAAARAASQASAAASQASAAASQAPSAARGPASVASMATDASWSSSAFSSSVGRGSDLSIAGDAASVDDDASSVAGGVEDDVDGNGEGDDDVEQILYAVEGVDGFFRTEAEALRVVRVLPNRSVMASNNLALLLGFSRGEIRRVPGCPGHP
ncbi:hypothetical protein C8F04DRAFT_1258427 [Mycena alexandri]|uniref:Uncharacterized protein n=1 Tax=Mycena alexandri TaxID=1745969 RepID=A0AAD6X231_9AGAR|nr:hypothetical protein C8F04DRAFT_1258427 [Mycena alexandri]